MKTTAFSSDRESPGMQLDILALPTWAALQQLTEISQGRQHFNLPPSWSLSICHTDSRCSFRDRQATPDSEKSLKCGRTMCLWIPQNRAASSYIPVSGTGLHHQHLILTAHLPQLSHSIHEFQLWKFTLCCSSKLPCNDKYSNAGWVKS